MNTISVGGNGEQRRSAFRANSLQIEGGVFHDFNHHESLTMEK